MSHPTATIKQSAKRSLSCITTSSLEPTIKRGRCVPLHVLEVASQQSSAMPMPTPVVPLSLFTTIEPLDDSKNELDDASLPFPTSTPLSLSFASIPSTPLSLSLSLSCLTPTPRSLSCPPALHSFESSSSSQQSCAWVWPNDNGAIDDESSINDSAYSPSSLSATSSTSSCSSSSDIIDIHDDLLPLAHNDIIDLLYTTHDNNYDHYSSSSSSSHGHPLPSLTSMALLDTQIDELLDNNVDARPLSSSPLSQSSTISSPPFSPCSSPLSSPCSSPSSSSPSSSPLPAFPAPRACPLPSSSSTSPSSNPWPLSGSLTMDLSTFVSSLSDNERHATFHFHPHPQYNDGSQSVVEAKSLIDYLHAVQSNATKQYLVYTMNQQALLPPSSSASSSQAKGKSIKGNNGNGAYVVQLSNKRWCITRRGIEVCLSNPKVAGSRADALRAALLS